jgi:hypothetical protein
MKKSKNLEFKFGILALGLSLGMSGCQMKVNDKGGGGSSSANPAAAGATDAGDSASGPPDSSQTPAVRVSEEAPAPGLAGVQIIYHSALGEALGADPSKLADAETLKAQANTANLEFYGEKEVVTNLHVTRLVRAYSGDVKGLSQQTDVSPADAKVANYDSTKATSLALSGFQSTAHGATSALDVLHWSDALAANASDLQPVEVIYHLQYQDEERTVRVQVRRDHVVSSEEVVSDSKIEIGTLALLPQAKVYTTQLNTQMNVIHFLGGEGGTISNQKLRDSRQAGQINISLATASGKLEVDYRGADGLDGQIPTQVPEKPAKADDARLECTNFEINNNDPCSLRPEQPGHPGGQGLPGNPGQDGLAGGNIVLTLDQPKNFNYSLKVKGGAGGQPSPGGPGGEGGQPGGPSYIWLQNIDSRAYDGMNTHGLPGNGETVLTINPLYNADCGPGPGTYCMRVSAFSGRPLPQGPAGPQGPASSVHGQQGASGQSCVEIDAKRTCIEGNEEITTL